VKHPVFLALKFSNCVALYYNTKVLNTIQVIQKFIQTTELLEQLQTKLLKENKSKQKADVELATNLDEKFFVFVISNLTDSLKRKKVIESIETMQNEFIGIACSTDDLPDCLRSFGAIEAIKKAYKESYDALMTICQNYEPEEQEESDDEYYSDQYDDSSKSSGKKKKEAEAPRTRNKTTIISNKKEQPAPAQANGQSQPQPKIEKNEEIILKKEELFDSQFEAPVFFNHENQDRKANSPAVAPPASASAFSKAVGFRNVSGGADNNPIFDTSQLNKAFSNNMGNIDFNDPHRPQTAFKSASKEAPPSQPKQ
jgi:hypothetical protein